MDLVLHAIKQGLNDSTPGARTSARHCFIALNRSWELEGERFFAGLPSNLQRGLQQAAGQYKRVYTTSSVIGSTARSSQSSLGRSASSAGSSLSSSRKRRSVGGGDGARAPPGGAKAAADDLFLLVKAIHCTGSYIGGL